MVVQGYRPREVTARANGTARYIIHFGDATKDDHSRLGGKCAGLATLIATGATVPSGFAVTTHAYGDMLAVYGLQDEIQKRVDRVSPDDVAGQAVVAEEIQNLIKSRPVPEAICEAVHSGYEALCTRNGVNLPVAVRSSGTAEDLPEASFAGQGDTYLWTVGAEAVVDRVRACWASMFTARAIAYRAKQGLGQLELLMAVGVQEMVNASAAGVAMSLDPSNGDRSKIVIESVWGLGEPLVSGHVTPDYFVIDKVLLEPVKRTIGPKLQELVADPVAGRTVMRDVEESRRKQSSLSEAQLRAVARVVKSVEKSLGVPQDIEWAIDAKRQDDEGVVLLQSRPETVWSNKSTERPPANSYATGIEGVLSTLMSPLAAREAHKPTNPEGGHNDSAGTFPKSL
jgi:pyruvate, water dikinase